MLRSLIALLFACGLAVPHAASAQAARSAPRAAFAAMIRYEDWKAVRLVAGKPLALYNLARDLGDADDVAAKYPAVIAHIKQLLSGARTESPLWPISGPPPAK